ncbi:MAG: EAL domain-containing protein [Novosphingobium sp.]|nr:EAL domain-containing protein [Novosphingobium sp.]
MNQRRVRATTKGSLPPGEPDRSRPSRAGGARDTAARSGKDRRKASSRSSSCPKNESSSRAYPRSLIGRDWVFATAVIAFSVLVGSLLSHTVPPTAAAVAIAFSIAVTACSRLVLPLEARIPDTPIMRLLFLAPFVALPMSALGTGLWLWFDGVPQFRPIHGGIVFVLSSYVCGATLNRRLPGKLSIVPAMAAGALIIPAPVQALIIATVTLVGQYIITRRYLARINSEEAQRMAAERVQKRSDELLSEYELSGQGWFWETDRRGNVTYVTQRIAKLVGRAENQIIGKPFTDLFVLDSDDETENGRTLRFNLSTRSAFSELEVRAATREDEERWWSITGRPVLDSYNNFLGFRGSGTDLTDRKRSQEHVTQLARFDSLTKLANRFQMAELLEKILTAQQVDRRACAIFLLDLDRFKQVNDTMGHPAGDALLRQVADRLRSTVNGLGNVGRLGGDEFQVILPGRHKQDDLAQLAHRIIENLSQPYSIDGARVSIGASIGISQCPDNGTTSEDLIRNADLALYAAKDGGRGRFHFYADDLHADAEERRQLEQDLRDAMVNGDLELHYQPVVSTTTEKITGFEALLRWNHPQLGYLSPARFIPVAEESGLVTQIGEWALRAACEQLSKWPESVRIAVNVSPLQFASPSLPAIITSAIANAQIAPSRLELEITESVFLNDDTSTDAMFAALKAIGVRLALDDFGTGYSSLGYLKKAPFDKIKIDQSFVRGATFIGSRNAAIIASIVSLAESLHMETTAEGVETLDELDLIRSLGCSHIQGYIYEQAITAAVATERLATGFTAVASGPQSTRPPRQTMLRKVMLEHGTHRYEGTIRNISVSGAMIEGLWDVPKDTVFTLHFSRDYTVKVTTRWSKEDRMGVEFEHALPLGQDGSVLLGPPRRSTDDAERSILRKAG